jgi:hypothetical protein
MNPQVPSMPDRGGLFTRVLIAAAVGALIVVCVVMPAEYRKDPTGVGRMLGLLELTTPVAATPTEAPAAAPESGAPPAPDTKGIVAKTYDTPFKTDTVKIPIGPDGEVEYKAVMKEGQAMIYSWEVDKGSVYFDFHGEPADPKKSKSYQQVQETKKSSGAFVAPFDGKHGWYWLNLTGDKIVVTLKLSGFYESHDYVK